MIRACSGCQQYPPLSENFGTGPRAFEQYSPSTQSFAAIPNAAVYMLHYAFQNPLRGRCAGSPEEIDVEADRAKIVCHRRSLRSGLFDRYGSREVSRARRRIARRRIARWRIARWRFARRRFARQSFPQRRWFASCNRRRTLRRQPSRTSVHIAFDVALVVAAIVPWFRIVSGPSAFLRVRSIRQLGAQQFRLRRLWPRARRLGICQPGLRPAVRFALLAARPRQQLSRPVVCPFQGGRWFRRRSSFRSTIRIFEFKVFQCRLGKK
jgi:hypothetical protein